MNDKSCINCSHKEVCFRYRLNFEVVRKGNCTNYYEEPKRGKWIPVSERLPKEEDYRPCYGLPDGCVIWQTDNGDIGFGWYYNSTKCWSDIYDNSIKTGKVIAWQPLPEPYAEMIKEEGDNNG